MIHIIASVLIAGSVVGSFAYKVKSFDTIAACEQEMKTDSFKAAVADMRRLVTPNVPDGVQFEIKTECK